LRGRTGDMDGGLAALAAAVAALKGPAPAGAAPTSNGGAALPVHALAEARAGAGGGAAEAARAWAELGSAFLAAGRPDDVRFCLAGGGAADAWAPAVHTLAAALAEVRRAAPAPAARWRAPCAPLSAAGAAPAPGRGRRGGGARVPGGRAGGRRAPRARRARARAPAAPHRRPGGPGARGRARRERAARAPRLRQRLVCRCVAKPQLSAPGRHGGGGSWACRAHCSTACWPAGPPPAVVWAACALGATQVCAMLRARRAREWCAWAPSVLLLLLAQLCREGCVAHACASSVRWQSRGSCMLWPAWPPSTPLEPRPVREPAEMSRAAHASACHQPGHGVRGQQSSSASRATSAAVRATPNATPNHARRVAALTAPRACAAGASWVTSGWRSSGTTRQSSACAQPPGCRPAHRSCRMRRCRAPWPDMGRCVVSSLRETLGSCMLPCCHAKGLQLR